MRARRSLLLLSLALLGLPWLGAQSPAAAPTDDSARDALVNTLLADVARQLSDHFHLEGDLRLALTRQLPLPALADNAEPRLIVTDFTSAPASSMLVRCRLEAGGAPLSSLALNVRAELWNDVWVARQPLPTGSVFDSGLLDVRRADLLRERNALPATAGGNDFVLARYVPAGQTLAWRDLMRRPLVRKGETVEVSAVDGALTVTVKAVAVQDAGRGETVLVRNLETRKEFSAVVVADGRAQIRL